MAQKSHGIQTLLEAEKDAAQIVERARAYRTQRIKDAHAEAAAEIDALRGQRDTELSEFERSFAGAEAAMQRDIDADMRAQLETTERAFAAKHDELVARLTARVAHVEPAAHRNLGKAA